MSIELGYWLKIGMTTANDDNYDDKWDVAMKQRWNGTHTELCETCKLFDVFEYPYIEGKPDDIIRNILTNQIYDHLQTSKKKNKEVDNSQYEIKAGQEFVYGASRKHVTNAIAIFERDLLINSDSKTFNDLKRMVDQNKKDLSSESDDTNSAPLAGEQAQKASDFFEKLQSNLPTEIKEKCSYPTGRPYMGIKSEKDYLKYFAQYSTRYSTTNVFVEVRGEANKEKIEAFIDDNDVYTKIPSLSSTKQGVKAKDKYYWEVTGDYSGEEDTVIQWFVENITLIYNTFEQD